MNLKRRQTLGLYSVVPLLTPLIILNGCATGPVTATAMSAVVDASYSGPPGAIKDREQLAALRGGGVAVHHGLRNGAGDVVDPFDGGAELLDEVLGGGVDVRAIGLGSINFGRGHVFGGGLVRSDAVLGHRPRERAAERGGEGEDRARAEHGWSFRGARVGPDNGTGEAASGSDRRVGHG